MKKNIQLFNLIYITLYVLLTPLQRYYLHIDGAGRIVFTLSILALLLNINVFREYKDIFRTPAFCLWVGLLLYSLANSFVKGFVSETGTSGFLKDNFLNPFAFLVTTAVEVRRDWLRTLRWLFFATLAFIIIGYTHFGGDGRDRMEAAELGNLLPLIVLLTMFVACILHSKKCFKAALFWPLAIFLLWLIILSGTRKAIGGYLILFVGYAFCRYGKMEMKSLVVLLLFSVLIYWGGQYIIDHTQIGMRIRMASEIVDAQLVENTRLNALLLTFLGDRSVQYLEATNIFRAHFWTGIGLMNYPTYVPLELRLHSEYMVQLCENGLIGFLLLFAFYFSLFLCMRHHWKQHHREVIMGVFGLITIMFIDFTAWTYNATFAMAFYAIILNYAYNAQFVMTKNEGSNSSSRRLV